MNQYYSDLRRCRVINERIDMADIYRSCNAKHGAPATLQLKSCAATSLCSYRHCDHSGDHPVTKNYCETIQKDKQQQFQATTVHKDDNHGQQGVAQTRSRLLTFRAKWPRSPDSSHQPRARIR